MNPPPTALTGALSRPTPRCSARPAGNTNSATSFAGTTLEGVGRHLCLFSPPSVTGGCQRSMTQLPFSCRRLRRFLCPFFWYLSLRIRFFAVYNLDESSFLSSVLRKVVFPSLHFERYEPLLSVKPGSHFLVGFAGTRLFRVCSLRSARIFFLPSRVSRLSYMLPSFTKFRCSVEYYCSP